MRAWLKKRREAAAAEAHRKGWNWAAGELLRGVDVEAYMEHFDTSYDMGHPFNIGAMDAVREWNRRMP